MATTRVVVATALRRNMLGWTIAGAISHMVCVRGGVDAGSLQATSQADEVAAVWGDRAVAPARQVVGSAGHAAIAAAFCPCSQQVSQIRCVHPACVSFVHTVEWLTIVLLAVAFIGRMPGVLIALIVPLIGDFTR